MRLSAEARRLSAFGTGTGFDYRCIKEIVLTIAIERRDMATCETLDLGAYMSNSIRTIMAKAYLKDEEEDLYWSQGAVELIEKIGTQNWLIMQI